MPAFTLYGARGSTNTDRVRLTLAEGGFKDYELVHLDLRKGEQKVRNHLGTHVIASADLEFQADEHMRRNPWGKVPVLAFPDGFNLAESRAISLYLAQKYSFPLLPPHSDIDAMALFDQAQSVETCYFAEPAGRIAFEKFAKKLMGMPANEAIVSDAIQALERFFDTAETLLQRSGYMAGDNFTLVDIYYIPLMQRLFACGYGDLVVKRDAVRAWWERCVSRSAVQELIRSNQRAAAGARQ